MARIITGHFDQIEHMRDALQALQAQGVDRADYASYFLNPPGQHGLYPLGGDVHSDEGAREAGKGALTGAAIGGAAGLAVGSVAGPPGALAGAGLGAYLGSLAGALSQTREPRPGAASKEHPVETPGGPVVAVRADDSRTEATVVSILDAHRAFQIARSEGEWREGGWRGIDPRAPVEVLKRTERQGQPPEPGRE